MNHETSSKETPSEPIYDALVSVYLARACYVVARLGIADLLQDGAMRCADLARMTKSDESSLYRILRALASVGVFKETPGGQFQITPQAELLRSNVPNSIRDWVLLVGCPENWTAFGKAFESVQQGKPAFDLAHNEPFYAHVAHDSAFANSFVVAMSNWTDWQSDVIAQAYDFSRFRVVVDVGGGRGSLLLDILRQYELVRGVLYDGKEALGAAKPRFLVADLADRCEFVEGSFFDQVPAGGDLYVLKHVLRDWNDEKAGQILSNCLAAMTDGARLLIIDGVLDPANNTDRIQKLIDLEQMFWLTGRIRTKAEWSALLSAHGLTIKECRPTTILDATLMEVKAE